MQASMKFIQVDGVSLRPQRFLRREWKRNKPHLPKSTSLPILQLTPTDRPIFTCRQCGFINTLIPLCLWCCWTSELAHCEFEMTMPRVRRASAPSRVFWKCNANAASIPSKPPIPVHISKDHVPSDVEAIPGLDVSDSRFLDNGKGQMSSEITEVRPDKTNQDSGRPAQRKRNHHNILRETFSDKMHGIPGIPGRVTKATFSSNSSARSQSSEGRPQSRLFRRPIPPSLLIPPVPLPAPRHSLLPKSVDRPHTMTASKTFSTKSLRSAPIVIDFKNFDDPDHNLIKSKSMPNKLFPSRTLRRKKGISVFRPSPPQSVPSSPTALVLPLPQRPQSASDVQQYPHNIDRVSRLSVPINHNHAHTRSKSHPTDTVPLGHPNRPYYSAIRPNMSRPSSPVSSPRPHSSSSMHSSRPLSLPPPARAPSPGILSMLSASSVFSTSVFEEHEYLSPTSSTSAPSSAYDHVSQLPFTFASSMSRHRSGFSLSGETELRMAIARDMGPESAEGEFKFRDMSKKSRRQTKVMQRVRKLKKGLKNFVLKSL